MLMIGNSRENDQCLKSTTITNKQRWSDSPKHGGNLINTNNTPLPTMRIFPDQTNLHAFILHLHLPCPHRPPFLPLTFNLIAKCHGHPPSSTHITLFAIPKWHTASFNPITSIKNLTPSLSMSCTPHIALILDISSHFQKQNLLKTLQPPSTYHNVQLELSWLIPSSHRSDMQKPYS